MVPRKPKLIAAAAVLAVGLGLAWPWRRGDSMPATLPSISTPLPSFGAVAPPHTQPVAATSIATVPATAIGASGRPPQNELASSQLSPQQVTVAKPLTSEFGQLIPIGGAETTPPSTETHERTHVIHSGDSLERLAQRYLGDAGRAIEIFDLNRQVLENPHLLPIGTELKIPLGAKVDSQPSAP